MCLKASSTQSPPPPLLFSLFIVIFCLTCLFFFYENLNLQSYEKQPVYKACNRKLKLNMAPSKVELCQHRAVWELPWIHLKCVYGEVLKQVFLWFSVFPVLVRPAIQDKLETFSFLASGSRRQWNICEKTSIRTWKIMLSSSWVCCWNISFHA